MFVVRQHQYLMVESILLTDRYGFGGWFLEISFVIGSSDLPHPSLQNDSIEYSLLVKSQVDDFVFDLSINHFETQ